MTNDWRELREFSGVDLLNSFVLSWRFEGESLLIDVDVCLEPKHPFYEAPRPAERHCIRAGVLEFPYCSTLRERGAQPAEQRDVASGLRHGKIMSLRRVGDGRYELLGVFGHVCIESERPLLRLKDSVY